MSVLFKCSSLYTIFTSAVLCELYYKDEETILLLSDQIDDTMRRFFEIFQKEKIFFNEIIILNETSVDIKDIENDIRKVIQNYDIDVFHIFLFDTYSIILQHLLPLKTKIIVTEEGTMTYSLKESYELDSKSVFFYNKLKDKLKIDWDRIDEILLYEPKAFHSQINTKVNKINIEILLEDKKKREIFLKKINKFFHYFPKKEEYNVIYLENNFCNIGSIQPDFERWFLKNLLYIIEESKYVIKLHPHETKDFYKFRYNNKKVNIQNSSFFPWEIILLNKMHDDPMQKLVIIGTGSTAEYNSIIFGNICFPNIIVISLLEIIKYYLTDKDVLIQQLHDTNIFYNTLEKVDKYKPKSFQEFEEVFNKIMDLQEEKKTFNEISEINWLRERCVRKGVFLDSTIEQWELIIRSEKKVIIDEIVIYDYTDDIIELCFEFSGLLKKQKYTFECKVSENIPCENIEINKIYALKQEQSQIHINEKIISLTYDILGKNNCIKGNLYVDEPIDNLYIRFKIINLKRAEGLLKSTTLDNRNQLYYNLLYNWICLKQKDDKFLSFLQYKGYEKIAIYGYGKIGKLLYEEIKHLDIEISFLQKEGNYITEEGVRIFEIGELQKNKFDLIIITPIYEGEKIKSDLMGYFDKEIIKIDDLLEKVRYSI